MRPETKRPRIPASLHLANNSIKESPILAKPLELKTSPQFREGDELELTDTIASAIDERLSAVS